MKWWDIALQALRDGGPGTCQFTLTNACNACCSFCNFAYDKLPPERRRWVTLEEAREAMDILSRHGVRFMVFTGGEPMMHRDLFSILDYARDRGMVSLLVTNGSALVPRQVDRLAEAGLRIAIISIDAARAEVHEQNRGLKGVCGRIREANRRFRSMGVGTTASVTVSRLLGDLEELPPFLESLGFQSVTFSYPLTSLNSSYLGFGSSDLVAYSREEMHRILDAVKALKRRFQVLNPSASIDDMHRYLEGAPQRFECLGGWKQFYLDWNLMLWRCNNWREPLCHIRDFDGSQRVRDGCTACMVDCFRDASVLQYPAVSLSDGLQALRRGDLATAVRRLFNRNNLIAAGAVLECRHWRRHL